MHDLDIGDKHIAIMGIGAGGDTGVLPFRRTNIESLPEGAGRLTFEAALDALKTVPIDLTGFHADPDAANIETIGKITTSNLSCMIVKGLPLQGEPVIKTLNQMGSLAERIVQTFEAHCFGGDKPPI
jgi:hypothetical protein